LLWNYSDKPISLTIHLDGIKTALKVNSLVLDATAPIDDQNIRLRPGRRMRIKSGTAEIPMSLAPWQVTFWSFEARGI
jgi:hypothetical protein